MIKLKLLSVIQYETLEMIELANKDKSAFFSIFKTFDKSKYKGWKIAILVEDKLYIKNENEKRIYVYRYKKIKESNQYIIFLKCLETEKNLDLISKVKKILSIFKLECYEINTDRFDKQIFESMYLDVVLETKSLY